MIKMKKILLVGLMVLGISSVCFADDSDHESREETNSINAVKASLKDSNSAKFRNFHGFCGEVNSKNGFGGYTGFRRYIAGGDTVAIEGENITNREFRKAWTQICK
jgi:hypothetical protein